MCTFTVVRVLIIVALVGTVLSTIVTTAGLASSSSSSIPLTTTKLSIRMDESRYPMLTSLFHKYYLNQPLHTLYESQLSALKGLFEAFTPGFLENIQYKNLTTSHGRINYLDIRNPDSQGKGTLILCHGYASGVGFFYSNYEHFSHKFERVIAIDWIGMGASSRYKTDKIMPVRPFYSDIVQSVFPITASDADNANLTMKDDISMKTVDYFIDSLQEFVKHEDSQLNSENFTLLGHSMGGYLVGKYALKYPSQVNGVIMASPAGLGSIPAKDRQISAYSVGVYAGLAKTFWSFNYTPQYILRLMGPDRAKNVVKTSLNRRFSSRWDDNKLSALSNYLYSISSPPASGEFSLNSLLVPIFERVVEGEPDPYKRGYRIRIVARDPIKHDLSKLGTIPLLVMFGDDDWISYPNAKQDCESLKANGLNIHYTVISKAGHHLYMDNTEEYHNSIDTFVTAHCMQ